MAEHRRLIATWQVGPYPIDVYEHSSPISEDDPDGMTDTSVRPREIRIHQRVVGRERWAVLAHELVHLALQLMTIELRPRDEEVVCDAVALTIAEALASYLSPPPGEDRYEAGSKP